MALTPCSNALHTSECWPMVFLSIPYPAETAARSALMIERALHLSKSSCRKQHISNRTGKRKNVSVCAPLLKHTPCLVICRSCWSRSLVLKSLTDPWRLVREIPSQRERPGLDYPRQTQFTSPVQGYQCDCDLLTLSTLSRVGGSWDCLSRQ